MTTSTDIVNQALQLTGDDGPLVTGVAPGFDESPAGVAASLLYTPTVQTVARQFGYDFSRNTALLTLTDNVPALWPYEYLYPGDGIEIRQLRPQMLGDPNNPIPVNWDVCNSIVDGVQKKVIQTDVQDALAIYTNQPSENLWDPLFRETVVRLLASGLAMALEGRPETARDMLESGGQFGQISETRQD